MGILEKKNDRIGDVKNAIELIENDLQNIVNAKKAQDKEEIEAALNSFYRNRKTLKDIVDEDIMKDFDRAVDAILEKPVVRQGKGHYIQYAMDLIENDLQNIMDAKVTKDKEDMEVALNSFYKNRKTVNNIVDEDIVKEFERRVDAILKR